jgi:hypothetical protein
VYLAILVLGLSRLGLNVYGIDSEEYLERCKGSGRDIEDLQSLSTYLVFGGT